MGAWATGPYENDTGLDFLDGILEKVEKVAADEDFDEWQYDTVRAAVEVFLSIGPNRWTEAGNCAESLRNKLNTMLGDTNWLDSWKSKEPAIESITGQRDKLDKFLKDIGHPEQKVEQ